jgi:multidrug efflux pump subunit AcrB
MTRNSVASNLLMFVLIVAGLVGAFGTKQEVFPEFSIDQVNVSVPYPGASPDDVEQGIILAIEERVRGLDGVKRVDSTASEGAGTVRVQVLLGSDPQQVLADVKNEVDRITTFPLNAEEPVVSLAKNRRQVVSLVLSGNQDLRTLHDVAERARKQLLATGEITQIELEGVPPLEIAIEVPRAELERFGVSLEQIAAAVSRASLELPAGAIETDRGEIRVRLADRRESGSEIADLLLKSTRGGGQIRLGDIATITDGYEDTKQLSRYDGKPAVRLTAYRVGKETPTAVAAVVRDYAAELRAELPDSVGVHVWNDDSESLRQRIDLLLRNAGMGLALVLILLALFLDLRLAFWVSLGIPISFLGAFVLLGGTTLSVNMITLFAFIVTLGMVVDDAIVVGERAYALRSEGLSWMDAAIAAAQEMAVPITFAILTTVAAFAPMFFVPGTMGKIFKMIPAVVIAVLIISLVESFLILPAHLGHGEKTESSRIPRKGVLWAFGQAQGAVARGLEHFTREIYRPVAAVMIRMRYITLAGAMAVFALTIGFVASGRVPFNFFPQLEGDVVVVQVRLPYGAPLDQTEHVADVLQESLLETIEEFGGREHVRGVFTRLGESAPVQGPGGGTPETGSHLLAYEVALVPSGERSFSAEAFSTAWRERTAALPQVDTLKFSAATGPGAGDAVAVQLIHDDDAILAEASSELADRLAGYEQLTNVQNGYLAGKPQVDFHLRPEAELRSSFYGAEAIREQRDRNEIKVVARLPKAERESEYDLESLMIRSPSGKQIPLGHVAGLERGRAPTSIKREGGRRTVDVSAQLAEGVPSPQPVISDLEQNEQKEAFGALGKGYLIAMFVIYALLAVPFRSYIQPVIIMAVIPFGFVGAIAGHAIMGYGLSLMSMFGLVALSGVVVNDSLVLIDATNKARRRGLSAMEAVLEGGVVRFRPILLTSLTTFVGLAPMLAETSVQARFLIPMAISLAFGVLAATVIVLLLVPALYMVVEDARALFGLTAPEARSPRAVTP